MKFIRQLPTAADMTLVNRLMGNKADRKVKLTRGSGPQPTGTSTIYYTTTDNTVYHAFDNASNFGTGVTLVSNTYSNGQGVATYNGTLTKVADGTCYEATTEFGPYDNTLTPAEALETTIVNNLFTKNGKEYYMLGTRRDTTDSNKYFVIATETANRLKSVILPDTITTIGDNSLADNQSTSGAFSCCVFLESANIPSNVTDIKHFAFYNCKSLTGVVLPSSVTTISHCAFNGCAKLTSVNLGDTQITSVEEGTFKGCSFTSIVLPNTLTVINSYSFQDCSGLTSITIPESVTSIPTTTGCNAGQQFRGCTALTTINMPNTVTEIGSQIVMGAHTLTINYNGTTEQWGAIAKPSDWNEGGTGTIHTTNGDISIN